MHRVMENGKCRDVTAEEKKQWHDPKMAPLVETTLEERVEKLEEAVRELQKSSSRK